MHAFKDAAGEDWLLQINVGAIKRVRALLGVDLLALEQGAPPLITRLGTDVILLCDVIFVLLKPQADALGITDEQFGAALEGEAILNAQTAFYEELESFFQSLGRIDVMVALQKQRAMIDAAMMVVQKQLELVDPLAEVEMIFGEQSMNSQPSAG